jgi:HEAT repeat protein
LYKEKLVEILKGDKNPSNRASAAYLLAHVKNGEDLVQILLPSIYDDSYLVRNNVMRVLSEIGMKHPEIDIPLSLILQAVNFPNVTDRNKSLAILYSLAKRPEMKERIVLQVGNILVELLKLKQPNNHESAWAILKELSGKDFDEYNYGVWSNWVNEHIK